MRKELREQLSHMTPRGVIGFISENPGVFNKICMVRRPAYMQEALDIACSVLPNGRSKRALDYVRRNNGALLFFGGNDAVGPALREAHALMANED